MGGEVTWNCRRRVHERVLSVLSPRRLVDAPRAVETLPCCQFMSVSQPSPASKAPVAASAHHSLFSASHPHDCATTIDGMLYTPRNIGHHPLQSFAIGWPPPISNTQYYHYYAMQGAVNHALRLIITAHGLRPFHALTSFMATRRGIPCIPRSGPNRRILLCYRGWKGCQLTQYSICTSGRVAALTPTAVLPARMPLTSHCISQA